MLMQNTINRNQFILGAIACAMGGLFYCYEFILRIIPGALQGELSQAFGHVSASTFGQVAALYYFAYTPMQLPVGMLMDRFGPRKLLSFACISCMLGSYFFGFSSSLSSIGLGRFLVGFGSSFAFVGVLSLAVHWLPPRYFSLVTGLVTTLSMFGVVYGEVKVTSLAATVGLDHVLWMTVFGGLFLTVLIFLIVRDSPGEVHTRKQPFKAFLKEVWRVLCSPQVWLIGLVGASLYTSLSVFGELWGKSYLEQAHHLTKIEAAKCISLMFFGWALGAPLAGYWSDRTARRVLPLMMGALISLIAISLVLYGKNLSFSNLSWLMFIYGVASGTEIIVFIMAKENSGALVSGTVFAVVNMIVSLGGVIFQPLVGWILDQGRRQFIHGEYVYSIHDYQIALSILPISLIFVMFIGLFFLEDKRRQNGG
jgi:MFS family permease